ncbi:heme ABC transporter [Cutibacterium acnes JCM 18920]|nr:heme ABC transporter [Cutibacterium acnes JCM 18920]
MAKATLRLPVTTTDGTGRRVTIKNANRIIVGGEDVADILAALGWRKLIYAAPTNSVAEAAVNAPKHYGFSKKTGMEGLLSIDGTLFIGNNPMRHGRLPPSSVRLESMQRSSMIGSQSVERSVPSQLSWATRRPVTSLPVLSSDSWLRPPPLPVLARDTGCESWQSPRVGQVVPMR